MKIIKMLTFFTLIGIISGCSESTNQTNNSDIKIGMAAIPGGFDDMSFNYNCKAGLDSAMKKYGFSVRYIEEPDYNSADSVIEYLASNNYSLIFGNGFYFSTSLKKASQKYSDKNFVIIDDSYEEPNGVNCIIFNTDEAAFPLGYLAAYWADTKDNTNPAAGCIGGMDIPQVNRFIEPFLKGIIYYNLKYGRNVDTTRIYAGDFTKADLGDSLAKNMIDNGVDIIFAPAGGTGTGALIAAKQRGKWAIGHDVDCYFSIPDSKEALLSSCMKRLDNAVYNVAESFINKTLEKGGVYKGKLSNKGVGLAPFHDYDSQIPDSIKSQLIEIQNGIMNGTIKTGWN